MIESRQHAAPLPPLPAVAVVDHDLVARRRRIARPLRWVGAVSAGLAVAVTFSSLAPTAVKWVALAVLILGVVAVRWTLPWTGARPGSDWYLGLERGGLRLAHGLARGGQVFLPWAVVAAVRPGRSVSVRVLRIGLRPNARPALQAAFEPGVVDTLLRRGFAVGLQGTSTTAREAADLVARVRS